jgi:hypothetical protein
MRDLVPNIQRVLKRADRALSGPIVEFSEQFLYGHREILINFANLNAKSMIKGSVEHGWALDSGRGIRKITGGRHLYLAWSHARISRSEIFDKTTVAIGAPFIYAHKEVESSLQKFLDKYGSQESRILFFPVHGNEFSQQNPESQISLFRDKYDPREASVCLYWVEFINPAIYNLYKEAGFKILCAGFSGQMEHTGLGYSARRLAGSPIGGRPKFILNIIAIMAAHSKIVFGGLGSATFYAGFMRKNIELFPDYLTTTYLDMDSELGSSFGENLLEMRYVKYVADFMGCPFNQIDYNSSKFHSLADLELGVNDLLTQEQLKVILSGHIDESANPQSLGVYKQGIEDFEQLLLGYL